MGVLDGKVAIITGAGSGMGRETALLFAREGAHVVAADVADGIGGETVSLIEQAGGTARFVHADVSRAADMKALVQAAVDTFGRLDIMFNNAGIEGDAGVPTADCTEENWDRIMGVNLKGVFLGMKYAIPELIRAGGGVIISTASLAGLVGVPGMPAYTASKGGVVQLTKAAALEYASQNIRVNCICPGAVTTAMTARLAEQYRATGRQRLTGVRNPMSRSADPNEIAQVALFLASDASSYMTGVALPVDGGSYAQ
ncbi:MAG: glucose 1-dehydrogenase [Chloroflexi bacterium]|nr:glucose 1-dehydrogenase [Chloroflexota bacterium]